MKNIIGESKTSNWYINPSKKQLIIVFVIWLIGTFLTLIAITDLFRDDPFSRKNAFTYFNIFLTLTPILHMYSNYKKKKAVEK